MIVALVVFAIRRRSLTLDPRRHRRRRRGRPLFPGGGVAAFVGQIFLRLIRTIVAPLLFATLVVGIAGHSNLRQVGRMGVKSLVYFEVVTTLALLIGWAAITISRAGEASPCPATSTPASCRRRRRGRGRRSCSHIFPENIAKSVVDGEILQVVVFSVIFGSALAMLPEERRRPLLAFAESLAETMFKFTGIVMLLAPLGVGAAIAYTVGHLGVGVLVNLAKLLATFYVAVAVFVGVGAAADRVDGAGAAASGLRARWPSRCRSPLPPPAPRRRCRARWRRWSGWACRARSWPS